MIEKSIKKIVHIKQKKGIAMKPFYEEPNVILIVMEQTDIVRTSPGDNYEGDDFPAFEG